MSTTQYIGRLVDILAWQGGRAGNGEVLLRPTLLEGDGGKITTGIQKLAQRLLLRLFTELGSIPHLPEEGTNFLTEARQGTLRTALDVEAAFSEALFDVERQLKLEEATTDPADERLSSAEIVAVQLQADRASIRVRVRAVSGDSTEFIAPIATTL